MRKIIMFNLISIDGYFSGPNGELDWHNVDDEFNKFAAEQMSKTGMIIFGRKTYELMRDFWPTYKPADPENTIVREKMNALPKVVFSKTLNSVEENENWKNVKLIHEIKAEEIKQWKQKDGHDMVILGSGTLVQTMMNIELIDEYRLMVIPVILGKGKLLFQNIRNKHNFKLLNTRAFGNGNVLLYYHNQN